MHLALFRFLAAVMKLVTPVLAAAGFLALSMSSASAVTIDFSVASLNGSNGFTVTGYQLVNGQCPSVAPCSTLSNQPNVVEVSANSGTFDLLSFMYDFQGQRGDLSVISNLSTQSLGIISIVNSGNSNGTYNVVGSLLQYFSEVSWIKFFTDTQANVRIDNITVAAVPLPAGIPLLGAGIGLLGYLGWRKKRSLAS